jgi:hypothetical protein
MIRRNKEGKFYVTTSLFKRRAFCFRCTEESFDNGRHRLDFWWIYLTIPTYATFFDAKRDISLQMTAFSHK